jgi:hypothetical protein
MQKTELRVAVPCLTACLLVASAVVGSAAGGERPRTSPASQAAGADCSRAAALPAVERLRLSDMATAVGKVLCGSFTGPGSQTMVVSLGGQGSSGMLDWVVFRWDGTAWQFVMKQHRSAVLTAAGADIRETVSIFRPGDPRCCPSGGKKTRLWHWDGTRLIAGPWQQSESGAATARRVSVYFFSPSRNISCQMGDDRKRAYGVYCQSNNRPGSVGMGIDGSLRICHGRGCVGNPGEGDVPPPTVLGYGRHVTVGRFRCLSQVSGVTCTVIRSGKGFTISRAGIRRVGP